MFASSKRWIAQLLRATGLRRWFRRVDLVIVRRDLSQADLPTPEGRSSPMGDPADFYLDHAEPSDLSILEANFPKSKHRHFRKVVADPDSDFVIRTDKERGIVWCFMMHSQKRLRDSEYGFTVPICEGRDVFQFDGWVNPQYRGLLIGILGTNYGNQLRRSEGFERIYATVREKDARSLRLHARLGYRPVGKIRHWRWGPFRGNRIDFVPGEHPEERRIPRSQPAILRNPVQPGVRSGPARAGYTLGSVEDITNGCILGAGNRRSTK